MTLSVLAITDGTTRISLLGENGYYLNSWRPAISGYKGGGVRQSSSMADGSRPVDKKWDDVIETFDLKAREVTQDLLIYCSQELRRLLEKASDYWTTSWQNEPVWLEVKASRETNTRYAILYEGRIPEDENPFAAPFLQPHCAAAMDNIGLIVERGHWGDQKPGDSSCVSIRAGQSGWQANVVQNESFEDVGAEPPVFDSWSESISAGTTLEQYSKPLTGSYCCRMTNTLSGMLGVLGVYIYQDITVVTHGEHLSTFFCASVRESTTFPPEFPPSTTPVYYSIYDVTNGAYLVGMTPYTPPVINKYYKVGQYFDVPDTCNTIRVYFYGSPTTSAVGERTTVYIDEVSILESVAAYGVDDNMCIPDLAYISNKKTIAQLTHIYYWDDDGGGGGGAWSANLLGAAMPAGLLPAVPAIDDFVIFGIDTSVANSGPFDSLVFDIGAIQTDLEITWRFSSAAGNPTGWNALSAEDNTADDGSGLGGEPFDTAGVKSVHWEHPATWTAQNPNPGVALGVTGYWVCAHVTAVGAAPAPPTQQNRDIYTITWPYFEIDQDEIGGDIPALMRYMLHNQSYMGGINLMGEYYILGARSVSRGENFTAYINISDEQNPDGMTVTDTGANTTFAADIAAPTGRVAVFNPGAGGLVMSRQVTIRLNQALAQEYIGHYRCFLRVSQDGGIANDFAAMLIAYAGDYNEIDRTETVQVTNATSDFYSLDMGELTINGADDNFQAYIYIYLSAKANAAPGDLYLYDLIMIPVDECGIACVGADGSDVIHRYFMDVDSVTDFKKTVTAKMRYSGTNFGASYSVRSASPSVLQHDARQRVWVHVRRYNTSYYLSLPPVSHSIYSVGKVQRYLSGRGNR